MKTVKLFLFISLIILLTSCEHAISKQPATAMGFSAIEIALKKQFSKHAYYTDLTISHNQSIGNIITTTVTQDPASLSMEQWNMSQDRWMQTSEVSLQIPQGSKAADFMFQLNDTINLKKLGELIEKAKEELISKKNLKNPSLHLASIKFPKNGDRSKTEYLVMLKPEHSGTTFTFTYAINGDLITMNY